MANALSTTRGLQVPAAALAALVAFSSDRLSLAMRGNIVEAVHARVAGERGDGAADDAQLAAAGGVRLQVAASALDSVEQRATEDAAQLAVRACAAPLPAPAPPRRPSVLTGVAAAAA